LPRRTQRDNQVTRHFGGSAVTDQTIESRIDEDVSPQKMRMVVAASAAGTVFEWYDFFIFGLLASVMAAHFFTGLPPAAQFIFALLTFAVGFAVRPLGAIVFGKIGDSSGRKGAFLVTITMMGVATFSVGLLPDYSQIGMWAPVLLVLCRIAQGFALGGEYGGAVVYVAEHAPQSKRGWSTSWVQTSAAIGLLTALLVVYGCRVALGNEAFEEWGWRLPFLFSVGLLGISLWIRLQLEESPAFARMKAEGTTSKAPLAEAFLVPSNLKIVLVALFALMMAQGVVWYTGHFYVQVFLEKQMKVDPLTINLWLLGVTLVSAVLYVFFGWLSDRVGRRPVMLFGMMLAAVSFFPAFHHLARAANPALVQAQEAAPVVVAADPATCSLQFNPVGKTPDGRDAFASSCDVAKSYLAGNGIAYTNVELPAGSPAIVRIGMSEHASPDISALDAGAQKATKDAFGAEMKAGLVAAGYPEKADPARIDHIGVLSMMLVFVIAATALYGPLAAALVELFPTRIRYTALSVPYHIGTGFFGGFMPAVAVAIVATTGNPYSGLWYPVILTAVSVLVAIVFMPETKDRDIRVLTLKPAFPNIPHP
jgi:MFS family permease